MKNTGLAKLRSNDRLAGASLGVAGVSNAPADTIREVTSDTNDIGLTKEMNRPSLISVTEEGFQGYDVSELAHRN